MALTIHRFASTTELFNFAAADFLSALEKSIKTNDYFDVALAGGGTAQKFLIVLKNVLANNQSLLRIRFFFSDERVVSLDSDDSNAGNARRILQTLPFTHHQFFPMYDGTKTAAANARQYQDLLCEKLKKNSHGIPVFDVVYLGIGEDGHTASLFPHGITLKNKNLVEAVHEKNILHERITLMPQTIHAASHIVMMATGANKASIIDRIIDGPVDKTALPAQIFVRDAHVNGVLLLAINPL